jgi:DNA (cytosine-5)-methyltransferase 1
MEEIRALPRNGFNAVSTFSGCGGSSTGYRMAGFRMLYASEFIPAAQDTYRANCAPYTHLDTRDIREVTGADLLTAAGLGVGEIDLFDGSPPCSGFSTVGTLSDGWGKVKKYSDTEQRVDDLFFEYARLIQDTQPRTFIAENVAGLVRGKVKGQFLLILKELKNCGYQVSARVLGASWLGVPQLRNRLIFVGVRNDLPATPVHPKPLAYQYVTSDALSCLADKRVRAIHDTSGDFGAGDVTGCPMPTITSGSTGGNASHYRIIGDSTTHDPETGHDLAVRVYADHYRSVPRKFTLGELRAISGFPADFKLTGSYAQRWERIGRAVPPVMMAHIAAAVRDRILMPLRDAGTI